MARTLNGWIRLAMNNMVNNSALVIKKVVTAVATLCRVSVLGMASTAYAQAGAFDTNLNPYSAF